MFALLPPQIKAALAAFFVLVLIGGFSWSFFTGYSHGKAAEKALWDAREKELADASAAELAKVTAKNKQKEQEFESAKQSIETAHLTAQSDLADLRQRNQQLLADRMRLSASASRGIGCAVPDNPGRAAISPDPDGSNTKFPERIGNFALRCAYEADRLSEQLAGCQAWVRAVSGTE